MLISCVKTYPKKNSIVVKIDDNHLIVVNISVESRANNDNKVTVIILRL